jgi:hypothetical protein
MKKIALIIAGVMVTGMAQAATKTLTDSGNLLAQDATMLNEDVTINLSSNVVAGIAYDNLTEIVIATCHEGGRTVARNVTVTSTVNNVTTTSTTIKEGAEMPTATTLQGTVIKEYPETACDADGANVTNHANSKL